MRFWSTVMLCMLCCASVRAHDPPFGTGVWKQGRSMLVRTNRGLVLSDDGVSQFHLLCNEALGINTSEVPPILPRAGGGWLIGTSHGLLMASQDLCTLTPLAPLDHVAVTTLARDPGAVTHLYASTGQSGFDNSLYLSKDGGKSFAAFGVASMARIFDHVLVSPTGSSSLFASGLRQNQDAGTFDSFFAASSDSGATFTEHVIALQDNEYALALLGVHPSLVGTLFGVAHAELGLGIKDRFLVSKDGGATVKSPLAVDRLGGFAITDDAKLLWVGGRGGLWRSNDAAKTFTQLSSVESDCVTRDGAQLYVCDTRDGVAGLSVSSDDGTTTTRIMSFTDVTTQVPCAFDSQVAIDCSASWGDWRRELQIGFMLDGGSAGAGGADAAANGGAGGTGGTAGAGGPLLDAGSDASASPTHAKAGCACSVTRARALSPLGSMFALGLALTWLCRSGQRRRAANRSRPPAPRDRDN